MARAVEALEGLAVAGAAAVGPLRMDLPSLVWSEPAPSRMNEPASRVRLFAGSRGGPGLRPLVLAQGDLRWELPLPIGAPEVVGADSPPVPVGDRALLVHGPLSPAVVKPWSDSPPELVILGNARALWGQGEPLVSTLGVLRAELGFGPAVWAPRVGLPNRLALLTYLGVDMVDDTEALLRAAQGEFLDPQFGTLDPAVAYAHTRCTCSGCIDPGRRSLEQHALSVTEAEGQAVRTALAAGRLRELVEGRTTSEPVQEEILRYADGSAATLLEERTPVIGEGSLGYVLAASFRRPEMRRFRSRFLERYRPPPSKRVLLVVPCSRTKPYRNSRSHRRFARVLEELPSRELVHVVSVTSPLGLVPRELEDVYPSRHYDIPVTGTWTEEERTACVEALRHLLTSGKYTGVVFHLPEREYRFLTDALGSGSTARWTCVEDSPTTQRSLAELSAGLRGLVAELPAVDGGPMQVVREELRALAGVQLGLEAAGALFSPPVRLAGRPWFQRLVDAERRDLATWREERGLFQLTMAGGARLRLATDLQVEMDPGVTLVGDLFGPGVASASGGIRTGDAVLLLRRGELEAVGEATMPGPIMRRKPRGRVVLVRHRRHPEVATDSTDIDLEKDVPPHGGPVV